MPRAALERSPSRTMVVSAAAVERGILLIRGERVMLDADLATLYGVTTKRLTQAVQRNRDRFPADFMFQLSRQEVLNLRSQFVTSSSEHGGRRYAPRVFTEQGVAMLSSVLRSRRAVIVNIEIMRAFVRLRSMLSANVDLARKLAALERKYDSQFKVVFDPTTHDRASRANSEENRLRHLTRTADGPSRH